MKPLLKGSTIPIIAPISAIAAEGSSVFPHAGAHGADVELAALEKHAAELQNTIAIETRSQAQAKIEEQDLVANQHQLAVIQTQIADLQKQQAQSIADVASQPPGTTASANTAAPASASDAQLAALQQQAAGLQVQLLLMHSQIISLQEKSDHAGDAAAGSGNGNSQIAALEQQAVQLQKTIDVETSGGEDARTEQANLVADQRQLQLIQSRIVQLHGTSNPADSAATVPIEVTAALVHPAEAAKTPSTAIDVVA